jgi:uncharacterized protein
MIIRFVLNNIFSFGEEKAFYSMPNPKLKTLSHHKYTFEGFEILKMSSIYGANGAGKSNLIKALQLFQRIVTKEEIPYRLKNSHFKFQAHAEKTTQMLAVEFIQEDKAFLYAIEITNGLISTEELYESGLGTKADKLIFERKTDANKNTSIKFSPAFEDDEKSQLLKDVLLQDFVKPTETILKLISNRENKHLKIAKKAYNWFSDTLTIITPESKPNALAHRIDKDNSFKLYAEDIMSSLNIGITGLISEKRTLEDFFGKDNDNTLDELVKKLEDSPQKMISLRAKGSELILVKENDKIFVKQLKIQHQGHKIAETFDVEEESDGTIRLLDLTPAFKNVISKNKVFVIDEIERSIHPSLIKELITKFSMDTQSKGQLIFTTHESNLLDQDIFRTDEIWFAEKNKNGSTDLYSLSKFKEHKTLDIQKGYLNGRYGSIPFLGNLQDLNWHKYDTTQ